MGDNNSTLITAAAPTETIQTDSATRLPEDGMALCLSGGGYRAMLFHLGTLWRLNEAGYLTKLDRISSVSGGSITAAYLGYKWDRLDFDPDGIARKFEEEVVSGIRDLARTTIDLNSVLGGLFWKGTIAEKVAKKYQRFLFSDATLQALPDHPRFVINATNVQSGALWRFSKPYMRDWRVGKIETPQTKLALAVAASSAFPPFLSPLKLPLNPRDFTPDSGEDLQHEPFTRTAILSDGGVYDNLGLETAWKRYATILVSDAGGQMQAEGHPKRDWAFHSYRVLNLIDNQVRALRIAQPLFDIFFFHKALAYNAAPYAPAICGSKVGDSA